MAKKSQASGERKFISSGDLATQLRSDKDAPWAELELTPRKLSARLKWFGIKPKHNTAKTERGYHRDHFDDAIARYPSPGSNDDNNPGTAPSVSVQASEISSDLQEHDGRLSELDTSIRPAGISVRDVFADQSTIRTLGRIGTGIPGDAPVMPGLDGSGALPESEARCSSGARSATTSCSRARPNYPVSAAHAKRYSTTGRSPNRTGTPARSSARSRYPTDPGGQRRWMYFTRRRAARRRFWRRDHIR